MTIDRYPLPEVAPEAYRRLQLIEVVDAARWLVDLERGVPRPAMAYRIAIRRLQIALERYDDQVTRINEPEEQAVEAAPRAFYAFLAVLAIIVGLALYGLATAFGWGS